MKKLLLPLMLLICTSAMAADWTLTSPASSDSVSAWPAANLANMTFLDRLVSNYSRGINIVYKDASSITVKSGEITCMNSGTSAHVFRQNTTDTTVDWSMIDTGTEAASTTYYVYAVADAATTTATFMISLSSSSPAGATTYKRIGSFYNDSNSNIISVTNDSDLYAPKLGDYALKSDGVNYQALTDGFVVGTCFANGQGTFYGYTDSTSTPTSVVAWTRPDGASNLVSELMFPVKKNNYYRTNCSYQPQSVYFVPLSN